MINNNPAKEGLKTDTDFPINVVCPECCAAVTAKCHHNKLPLLFNGNRQMKDETIFVNWFHFSRVELAKEKGFDSICIYTGIPTQDCDCHLGEYD